MFGLVALLPCALTLEQVHAIALRHTPQIASALAELEIAKSEELAAKGGFDPSWSTKGSFDLVGYYRTQSIDTVVEQPIPVWGTSVFAGYRYGTGETPVYDEKLLTNAYGEVRAGVSVPLLRNAWTDRRRTNLRRATLAAETSQKTLVQTEIDVMRIAAQRYFTWVGAGLKRMLAEKLLLLAEERQQQLADRVKHGDAPEFEVVDNARTVAQRQSLLIGAKRAQDQAAFDLGLFVRNEQGAPNPPTVELLPNVLLPPPPELRQPRALIDHALRNRGDLAASEAMLQQANAERALQHNQLFPQLDFRLTASQDFGPGSPSRQPFELEAAIVVEMPLVFRFQRGRAKAADAAVVKAETQLRLQRDRVATEVIDTHNALAAALARVETTQREVDLAAQVEQRERERFALGESTVFVVNLREIATLEARVRNIDATTDAHRAMADLRAATAEAARHARD